MEVLLKIKNAAPGDIEGKLNKALKALGTDFRIEKCININKSEKGYKLQGRINFQGLNISVENRKGSIRCGIDSDGHYWKTKINYPYGRIIGVKRLGHDGDHIDCYVGDNRQSDKVYIIHIKNCVTDKYDEDKVMLGFNNQKEAIAAFKTQYDNFSKIFDGIEKMSIYEFKECLKKKTKSIIVKLKNLTHENIDYKVTKALAGVGKALNCDFICKSIDTSKCSLEMTTDCNGNIIHRWKKIADEYLLNQKQVFSNAIKLFIERGYTQGTPITILDKIPEILQEKANMPNVKITVEPKILRKILTKPKTPKDHNHFMPVSLVNDLPIQLTKPLAILKDTENNHVIIVTEQFHKKRPVIAAIEVAKNIGGDVTVNSLRSFHDKRCESFFDFWNKKQVLFEDKKKMKALREFLHVRGFDSLNPSSKEIIPKPIEKSINHAEKPSYRALQDIIDNSNADIEKIKKQVYDFICKFLGLPKVDTINKSIYNESEHPRAENGKFTNKDNKKKFSDLTEQEKEQKASDIKNNILAEIEKKIICRTEDKKASEVAFEWVEKNIKSKIKTEIGNIIFNKKTVKEDLSHGFGQTKLDTLTAVKDVLGKGTYLGYEKDFDGKPIDNHYFAGKIKYGNEEKIVFCRVREATGDTKRFYVHEVFTEDELKKEASERLGLRETDSSCLVGRPLYKFILQNILCVNIEKSIYNESEHPRSENGQFTSKGGTSHAKEIERALKENVSPMPKEIPFTKENYDRLFKDGVETPIGHVKLGENQFDKLKDKDFGSRQKILAPMYETLKNPSVIIKTNDDAKLFCKEFGRPNKKNKIVLSVIIKREGLQISISTHSERLSQIQKKCRTILYKKNPNGNVGYAHREDVPRDSTISKSINKSITDELTVNGKIIFDPLYGKPLKQKDFAQMINKLENFLSRRLAETERQMLLQSTALGHLIALSKNGQTQLLLETVKLKNIVHKGKSFEQLCTDYETLKHNFDKVTDNEIAKLQFIENKIGVYVTSAKDATIKIIKDIYYDAVINHKSKQEISQEMYDQLGFLNRSWDTIARTESNNLKNHAFLAGSLNPSGKTYFRRRVGSYNACKVCQSHRNKIALWVDFPLADDKIDDKVADIAIWSGKTNIGRNPKDWWIPEGSTHPNCFCEWEKLLDEEVKYFRKSFNESDHPRGNGGRFISKLTPDKGGVFRGSTESSYKKEYISTSELR